MPSIHETAIVDEGATIGAGTRIWHWVHVCSGASIGTNCSLGQNVFIGSKVRIGNTVKIQNNVSVYDEVTIEDDVFCGPSVVFTNVYNPRSFIPRKTEYRPTLVKKGASLGANCTLLCGVTLGEYCFIGAGAVITQNVKPFALMVGNPARQVGWMSIFGEQLDLPLQTSKQSKQKTTCLYTGQVYLLQGNMLYVHTSSSLPARKKNI